MPPKMTRSAKIQPRNLVCAVEIPGTPEAEIFVPTKIKESESIPSKDEDYDYDYPCAQPPPNDPRYEKMFGSILGWPISTNSKDKESSSKLEEQKTRLPSPSLLPQVHSPPSPLPIPPSLSYRAKTKTPPPQYSEQATQTTPSLKRGLKRHQQQEEEEPNSGMMVCNEAVHIKYFTQVSRSRRRRRRCCCRRHGSE